MGTVTDAVAVAVKTLVVVPEILFPKIPFVIVVVAVTTVADLGQIALENVGRAKDRSRCRCRNR